MMPVQSWSAQESIVHQNYKNKVIKAKDIDSEITGMSTGHPVRQIRNQMTREYLRLEKEGAGLEELEYLFRSSIARRYSFFSESSRARLK